jgi:recombination protein RecA
MSKAEGIAKKFEKKYGHQSSATGNFHRELDVDSTGILSLDYALGTGGWPEGTIIECFGPPDIGKSSIVGFNGIIEAQRKGKLCGMVAMEPGFDPAWAAKNGVDLDELVIGWPDDGEEAFNMLYDMVMDDDIKFIVFDSIGAVLRPSEAGDKGKPSQGGQSALITWGVKRIATPAWKRRKTVILLNQIRDDMKASIPGMVESPGGHALKHAAEIRVQLKPGKDRYTIKEGAGKDAHDVMVGRQIVAIVKRTKKDEGSNKRASFDFYSKETGEYPFGVDKKRDIYNTAKRTGVIRLGGSWYNYDGFPGGKLQGEDAVLAWLDAHPEAIPEIRTRVLDKMHANIRPELKVVDGDSDNAASAA